MIFNRALETLRKSIEGREQSEEKLDSNRNGNVTFQQISLYVGGYSQTFNVHCDTRCSAITEFLNRATPDNVCVTLGPEAGSVLGVNGTYVPKFYVYLRS